jgi:DNA-binding transcriptional MerR regulator
MARQPNTVTKRARGVRRRRDVLVTREVFCVIAGVSDRQLSLWEHEDLLAPVRTTQFGDMVERLYDRAALERARIIRTLSEELEVNLPGIAVILHLLDQLER